MAHKRKKNPLTLDKQRLVKQWSEWAYKNINAHLRQFPCHRQCSDDVEGVVMLALVKAAEAFDESRGRPFCALARKTIQRDLWSFARQERARREAVQAVEELSHYAAPPVLSGIEQWRLNDDRQYRREQVDEMLDMLPPLERDVIELVMLEGMSLSQAAAEASARLAKREARTLRPISKETVRQTRLRAVRRLRGWDLFREQLRVEG